MRTIRDIKVLAGQWLRHRKLLRGQKNYRLMIPFIEGVVFGFTLYILFIFLFVIA